MIIGVPKEIKQSEYRVALTPAGVTMLTAAGHTVIIETGAGEGSGFEDGDFIREGASILTEASEVWAKADMIMKVKEPLQEEFQYFRNGLLLFTYLHLAAAHELTRALVDKGVTAIAYETIQLDNGSLPLLTPMSEVAGRMAVQVGAQFLEAFNGGRGVLLGGVPGVPPADVVIIGGGIVGTNAARMALGLGANVVIIEKSADRMRYLDEVFGGRIRTLMSSPYHIAEAVSHADLVIGAVLIPGAKAPHLVTEPMVERMRKGSVIVDVAVDQGGSIATVDRPTTHKDPVYIKHGVLHYAVANIPGAVPRTSTFALTNVTISYAMELANGGLEALRSSLPLRKGVNTHKGLITNEQVAKAIGLAYTPIEDGLNSISYDQLLP
ncbi:alanine dehydrogenase [Paenibacillus sp. GSMTC-2017]|uniref:alanine dehydrogenase n=1 Tax=Paenibacillus sp. GSMTC-2017 TaxID=2794350 RepID=UPI0018D99A4B|nr:alanine dehydrogenase [Paenibacillus sp. GSMTC-2017]MBH5318027.1 alanine dehydrogenase [Paenibacillus sp. GSMTC-2017]